MTTGRLGRRGTCFVAYVAQMIAFLILIFYRFHSPLIVWDWIVVIVMILLLALGDSVWESQVLLLCLYYRSHQQFFKRSMVLTVNVMPLWPIGRCGKP